MKKLRLSVVVFCFLLLGMVGPRDQTAGVYAARLWQIGEQNPNALVLHNTLGEVTWTRVSTGVYHGTRVGGFPENKTYVAAVLAMWPEALYVQAHWQSPGIIVVQVVDWEGEYMDDTLGATPIRVEVFP